MTGGGRWTQGRGAPVRTMAGRPAPVFLIALEKAISALAAAAGAVLAFLLHIHRSTDPLQFLLPGEVSEVPRDITVRWLYRHLPHFGPGIILLAAFGLTFWAVLLGAEAVGVWRGLGWGEFLVIVETASFLPFELYDIVRRPHPTGFITLTVNLLILWYVGVLYRRRLGERGMGPVRSQRNFVGGVARREAGQRALGVARSAVAHGEEAGAGDVEVAAAVGEAEPGGQSHGRDWRVGEP